MLEKSFGLLFFLKQSENTKNPERFIYLRITVDGISKELSTKRLCSPSKWNAAAGRAIPNSEVGKTLNAYLDTFYYKALQAKKLLLDHDKEISAEAIKNTLLGVGEEKKMILEVFQEHNKEVEALLNKDYAPGTLERYRTSLAHTRAFIRWKYKAEDRDIQTLDYEFISSYSVWLKTIQNCSHNTAVKYLSNFKKIVLICVKNGWLLRNPFTQFKMVKKEVERTFLDWDELRVISEKRFATERLNHVRDIFLFSCYTGLAYIDVKNLGRDQIVSGIDGELWINTHRQKTNSPTRLPLLPKALELVNRYRGHSLCKKGNHVLPVLSNQKMNAYLKEIADVCGINKPLTFHIARHTFATTITLSNGVPIETVSKMLGHKSLKQTQHYAKILDTKISHDMMVLRRRIEEKA